MLVRAVFARRLIKIMKQGGNLFLIALLVASEIFYLPKSILFAAEKDVAINEVAWMGTQESANDEWLELKNQTDQEIDLTGWGLKAADGAPSIMLQGKIAAQGFFLLERTSEATLPDQTADQVYVGSLANSGEVLELRDASNALVDQIDAAAGWPAGDNEKKLTMERKADGNWQASAVAGGTPKAANSEPSAAESASSNQETASSTANQTTGNNNQAASNDQASQPATDNNSQTNYDSSSEVFISEILPNPKGSDASGEFIELFNSSVRTVRLAGWRLAAGKKKYEFKEEAIRSGEYLVLTKSRTKLTLGNAQGEVGLWRPGETAAWQKVSYPAAPEAESLVKNEGGVWQWTTAVTPGQANKIVSPNHSPEVEFDLAGPATVGVPVVFDASDSQDEDNDQLDFAWEFGDGSKMTGESVEHAFSKAGSFRIKLTVSDGQSKATKSRSLEVEQGSLGSLRLADVEKQKIIINEIMPNPVGADGEEEWVELYNAGTTRANLLDWQLDDEQGGSKPFLFKEIWLEPQGYHVVERGDSSVVLNNSVDAVRLFDDLGRLADEVKYSSAKEGQAFARDSQGQWQWVAEATPGRTNHFSLSLNQPAKAVAAVKKVSTKAKTAKTAKKSVAGVKIVNNKFVRIKGVVAAKPGLLGSQIFYLESGGRGYQVYNYKKDFPVLKTGDAVEVTGETSVVNGETRIKTKVAADMRRLGDDDEPEAAELACDQLADSYLGRLVRVQGELTKITSTNIYLDDNNDEVLVYLKAGTGIKKPGFKVGDELVVTGILTKTSSGFRVLPRQTGDIVGLAKKSQVAGETASSSWALEPRDKRGELLEHLLIVLAGVVVVLIGWVVKMKRKSA